MNSPTLPMVRKPAPGTDVAVDMFTERGFELAQRVARALSSSSAVPSQFRAVNEKRSGQTVELVENPAAMGNCLVATEVARAVGMSITAVMQNADVIEGKLRWSGKFVIAAINASGRFTPLRFQMVQRGKIMAKYQEKGGWDREAKRYKFTEREVEVDDIECIAWALPRNVAEPAITADLIRAHGGRMLDAYKALGMPVVESAPVTMRMVVSEGWYGKPGSKWQGEMRALMFQYRAGTFFGNIHAPDIVMGMGRTAEEERDLAPVWDVDASGTAYEAPPAPAAPNPPMADVVQSAPPKQEAGLPLYDQAKFDANLPSWRDMVSRGMTPEAIVAKVSTVARLTTQQHEAIYAMAKATDATAAAAPPAAPDDDDLPWNDNDPIPQVADQ